LYCEFAGVDDRRAVLTPNNLPPPAQHVVADELPTPELPGPDLPSIISTTAIAGTISLPFLSSLSLSLFPSPASPYFSLLSLPGSSPIPPLLLLPLSLHLHLSPFLLFLLASTPA